jgi:hypothetical protein
MKNAKSKFFIAICSLAMALTTSCLEDSGNNSVSSTQKRLYCVYPGEEICILGPFTEAQCATGMLMNECPFGTDNIFGGSPSGGSPSPSSNSNPPPSSAVNPSSNSAENRATLTIKWNDGKSPDALTWEYKWTGTKYGIDMLTDILKTDNRLFLLTHSTGPMGNTIAGLGYDISGNNSIRLSNGGPPQTPVNGIVNTSIYDYDDWTCSDPTAHWAAGWYTNGYWSYWVSDNASGELEYSSLGASSRKLVNNARNLWSFISLYCFNEGCEEKP